MGRTVPGIRITENSTDLIIKIDKEMLVKEFETHPEIHWDTDEFPVPVKVKNISAFFEEMKYELIGEKSEPGINWVAALMDELFLHLWNEGLVDFIEKYEERNIR